VEDVSASYRRKPVSIVFPTHFDGPRPEAYVGEAVYQAKFYFAPLNAHADIDRMGWVACD
jgi:hypothetical protein